MDTTSKDAVVDAGSAAAAIAAPRTALTTAAPPAAQPVLQAKGSCWYCEKPLDSVRRFCGRGCADAFAEESAFIR